MTVLNTDMKQHLSNVSVNWVLSVYTGSGELCSPPMMLVWQHWKGWSTLERLTSHEELHSSETWNYIQLSAETVWLMAPRFKSVVRPYPLATNKQTPDNTWATLFVLVLEWLGLGTQDTINSKPLLMHIHRNNFSLGKFMFPDEAGRNAAKTEVNLLVRPGASSYCLLARSTVPDTNGPSLHLGLQTN